MSIDQSEVDDVCAACCQTLPADGDVRPKFCDDDCREAFNADEADRREEAKYRDVEYPYAENH